MVQLSAVMVSTSKLSRWAAEGQQASTFTAGCSEVDVVKGADEGASSPSCTATEEEGIALKTPRSAMPAPKTGSGSDPIGVVRREGVSCSEHHGLS